MIERGAFADSEEAQWVVLRCPSSKTLLISRRLGELGAWTPTWKRKRRVPKANVARLVTEAALPTFVFLPEDMLDAAPPHLRKPMRFDGAIVRCTAEALEPLRQISGEKAAPVRKLPSVGSTVTFTSGPYEGVKARVIAAHIRYITLLADGTWQPFKVASSLLQRIAV